MIQKKNAINGGGDNKLKRDNMWVSCHPFQVVVTAEKPLPLCMRVASGDQQHSRGQGQSWRVLVGVCMDLGDGVAWLWVGMGVLTWQSEGLWVVVRWADTVERWVRLT